MSSWLQMLIWYESCNLKHLKFHDHRAENETKAKLEKVAEIKKVNAAMMAIKSEISKYEDTLKEYQMYRKFLDNLTPQVCPFWHVTLIIIDKMKYYFEYFSKKCCVSSATLSCTRK